MQDLVPGFLKFVIHPLYGVILRLLGTCLVVVGLVAAGLDAKWAGFTPVVWLLLALLAFLGVICNELAQIHAHKTAHVRLWGGGVHVEAAAQAPGTPAAEAMTLGAAPSSSEAVEIYCVKCRDHRKVGNPKHVTLANGHPALQGPCPVCGTKLTRIVKAG